MNKKYERYINFIVSDIEVPYFFNMKEMYGLKDSEYELVLSKVYNQPVTIRGRDVYNTNGNEIYIETSDGHWRKTKWDENGNEVYRINEVGFWSKWDYDDNNNVIYYEDSDGFWSKHTYDKDGNEIYYEDSRGVRYEI